MQRSKFIRFCLITVVASLFLGFFSIAQADPDPFGPKGKRFGAGIIAGDPTGLTLKGYITPRFAIDAIASWSFVNDAFTLIGDLTYDFFDIPINSRTLTFPFYVGAGGKVGFNSNKNDDTIVGIRIPVGVALQWVNYPIEVFIEIAPGIEVAPETEFDVTGGVGARFYFL